MKEKQISILSIAFHTRWKKSLVNVTASGTKSDLRDYLVILQKKLKGRKLRDVSKKD